MAGPHRRGGHGGEESFGAQPVGAEPAGGVSAPAWQAPSWPPPPRPPAAPAAGPGPGPRTTNRTPTPHRTPHVLWCRSALVPAPPTTGAQMIAEAEALAKQGKPHYIEIQGAQYEGTTVWFNTMVASAGGPVLNPDATQVTLGPPAVTALSIMKQLASSPAADPSLDVRMENPNPLAIEAGTAAFELN